VRLTLDLDLPDALGVELETEAKRRGMTAQQWAEEIVEVNLASTRLPHVNLGRGTAQMCGTRSTGHEDETPLMLCEHRLLL
jgi:hypothetical protein